MRLPIPPPRHANQPKGGLSGSLLRRRADSNRRIKVLQTSPLPLGYGAIYISPPADTKPHHLARLGQRGHLDEELSISSPALHLPLFLLLSGLWQSGKRDSNPRHQPWQGCALPTELFPQLIKKYNHSALASQEKTWY